MAATKLPGNIGRSEYIANSEWFDVYVFDNASLTSKLGMLSDWISQKDNYQKFAQLFDSASSGVKGFTLYPFAVDNTGAGNIFPVTINTIDTTVSLPKSSDTVDENVQFEIQVNTATDGTSPNPNYLEPATKSFIDYEPFTTYQLYIPFVGVISLQSFKIFGKKLTLKYATDLHTGGTQITLDNGVETLYSGTAQLGITVPFGFTDAGAKEVARTLQCIKIGASMGMSGMGSMPQTTTTTTSSQMQTANGAIATGGKTVSSGGHTESTSYRTSFDKKFNEISSDGGKSSTTVDIKGGGVRPETASVVNGILNMLPDRASATFQSGGDFSAFCQPLKPYLIKIVPHIHDINDYGYYFGYACAEEVTIGDHTGYMEMSNIHMDNLEGCTEDEVDAIESFLKSGVIICDLATPST